MTPNRVVASLRVLQGFANSVMHFQRSVEPKFASIRERIKAYLDDFIAHCKTEEDLLRTLESFFSICREHNLFLSAKKCRFFLRKVTWCGRVIDSNGYSMDPHRLSGLEHFEDPTKAAELCDFVHCCNWMSTCIPNFVNIVKPLREVL